MKLDKLTLFIFLSFNLILNAQEEVIFDYTPTNVQLFDKDSVYFNVVEEPKFDGDIRTFIAKNTVYPKNAIDNEIEVMKSMSHQNIIRLFEVINDPLSDNIYIGSFIKLKLVNICKMDN